MNEVKIQILSARAKLPTKATDGSAGYDLYAAIPEALLLKPGQSTLIPTGLAMHIDHTAVVGLIMPRSKKGSKEGIVLGNLTGVIDSDYQGEWFISVWNRNLDKTVSIKPEEAIAQVLFIRLEQTIFSVVDSFEKITDRSDGGIGKDVDTFNRSIE
jgi:dUTP pyrophosphatase